MTYCDACGTFAPATECPKCRCRVCADCAEPCAACAALEERRCG